MKSKRKDINKYKTQSQTKPIGSNFFLRTSGNKPFDLTKLRVTARFNTALKIHSEEHLPVVSRPNIDQDLIIQKKTLMMNSNRLEKLKSDRRKVVLNMQQNFYDQIKQAQQSVTNTQEESLQQKESVLLEQHHSEQLDEAANYKKQQKQRFGCYQVHRGKDSISPISINYNKTNQNQHRITQDKNQLDLKKQSQSVAIKKIPFVFTHLKWRSRSEVFPVDKWKQKYGGSQLSRPNFKHLDLARRGLIALMQKKFSQKNSQMSKKLNFMHKEYCQNMAYSTIPSNQIPSALQKKVNFNDRLQKLEQIHNPESNPFADQKYKKQSISKKYNQEDVQTDDQRRRIILFYQAQNADPIQDILQTVPNLQQDVQNNADNNLSQAEKQLKITKKKWKLPSIQICTFNSTRQQQEDERRKTTKILNAHKTQRDWKQKPPKQIFLEKMMQQIPERWENGQSRDISRQQVGTYMHLKKEQQLRQQIIKQMEQRRMAQIRKQQQELFGNMEEANA